MAPFRHDPAWIDRFGERMIVQLPDEMRTPPAGDDEPFCYLMMQGLARTFGTCARCPGMRRRCIDVLTDMLVLLSQPPRG